MTSYDKELYITKDKFDLLERQFRKLVVKYDCKFSVECNNVTAMNILANYLFTDFYINVPDERRESLLGIATDLYRFYLNLNDGEQDVTEDSITNTIASVEEENFHGEIFPEIKEALLKDDAEFVHNYNYNHGHIPVFYTVVKWFANTKDRNLKLYDDAFGITNEKLTRDDLSDKYGITRERVRQIVGRASYKNHDLFKLLEENFNKEYYPFLRHSVIRSLGVKVDKINEEENTDLTIEQFCGILTLFGEYKTITTQKEGDDYIFIVNDSLFGSQFEEDWMMLQKLLYDKKRKYPATTDISSFFLLDEDDENTPNRRDDIAKLLQYVFGITLKGCEVVLPVNTYDIVGYAKRLCELRERPLSIQYLCSCMKRDYPKEEWIGEEDIREILSNSSYFTCKELKESFFFKARTLHKYNMGVLSFFDYWTNKSDKPVAIKRAFGTLNYLSMDDLIETIDLYPEYFKFMIDEYGLVYVGASGKYYGGDYEIVKSTDIK